LSSHVEFAILTCMKDNKLLGMQIENNLAILTLDNPPVNALSKGLIAKLKAAFMDLSKKENIKAVIITGADRTFCAGADVKELAAIKISGEGEAFAKNGQGLMDIIEGSASPVIAAINGACVGGGTQRLPKLIGRAKAVELILTGDKISAKDALALGLVNKIVNSEKLMEEVKTFANIIASKGRMAATACLKAIHNIEEENKLFGRVCETEDKIEGIKAFLEKRRAVFKGK